MKVEIGPYEYYEGKNRIVDVKIDKFDTWNLDHTLALVIYPALKKFRSKLCSAGRVDDEDVPENLRSTSAPPKKNEWDTDENWFKRWDYVLDEMIFAFEIIATDDDYHFTENERVRNGLRLFGKYYLSLWD